METPQLIGGFKQRFDKFVALYKKVHAENKQLRMENEQLKAELDEKIEQIKHLEENKKTVDLKGAFLATTDAKTAKQNINRLVREIDNCIALLNR